LETDALTS